MAALPLCYVYDLAKPKIVTGEINITTHSFKMMLATFVYIPDKAAHILKSEVVPYESSGAGYTAGGWALTTTYSRVGPLLKLDAADFVVIGLDAPWKWAVVYDDSHASKALLCFITPGLPQTPAGLNYSFQFHADGLLTLTDG